MGQALAGIPAPGIIAVIAASLLLTVERLYLKSIISGFFTPITTGPLFLQHRLLLPRLAIREPSLSFLTTLVPFSPCILWL